MVWHREADTQACAARLAQALWGLQPAGDAVIELRGDLGAGKTSFARHLMRALGVAGRIKSPSYAVVESYQVDTPRALSISHFDFYRFNDPDEWEEAGFRDLFATPGLKLVEWPEKAADRLPPADLVLEIRRQAASDADGQDARQVEVRCGSPKGRALLRALT